jgi:type IV secretion system protein TrbL
MGEMAPDSGSAGAAASGQTEGSGPPAWARRMKRNQTISHGVSTAHQAIRSGDHPSSGGIDLSEGE